jgi:hypothetical protein
MKNGQQLADYLQFLAFSGSREKEARAAALIFHWLFTAQILPRPQGRLSLSLRIFSEVLDPACLTAAFSPISLTLYCGDKRIGIIEAG